MKKLIAVVALTGALTLTANAHHRYDNDREIGRKEPVHAVPDGGDTLTMLGLGLVGLSIMTFFFVGFRPKNISQRA